MLITWLALKESEYKIQQSAPVDTTELQSTKPVEFLSYIGKWVDNGMANLAAQVAFLVIGRIFQTLEMLQRGGQKADPWS